PQLTQDDDMRVAHPGHVWFSVAAASSRDKPRRLAVYPLYLYPAPAWGLDLDDWKEGELPVLTAWWSDEAAKWPVAARVKRKDEKGKGDFAALTDLRRLPVKANVKGQDPVQVVVESVTFERRDVMVSHDVKAGQFEKRECLVVRLSFPDGTKPFLALPDGVDFVGSEHHVYTEAGKYTGVFWNVSPEKADALPGLILVPVEEFRNGGEGVRTATIELPKPGDRIRPQPASDKKRP